MFGIIKFENEKKRRIRLTRASLPLKRFIEELRESGRGDKPIQEVGLVSAFVYLSVNLDIYKLQTDSRFSSFAVTTILARLGLDGGRVDGGHEQEDEIREEGGHYKA